MWLICIEKQEADERDISTFYSLSQKSSKSSKSFADEKNQFQVITSPLQMKKLILKLSSFR